MWSVYAATAHQRTSVFELFRKLAQAGEPAIDQLFCWSKNRAHTIAIALAARVGTSTSSSKPSRIKGVRALRHSIVAFDRSP